MSWILWLKLIYCVLSLISRDWAKPDGGEPPPLISDEEFLALCKPGTNPDVALRVRRMVADSFGVNYGCLQSSTHFENDLGVC